MTSTIATTRYFTSYSGVRLPLNLVGELTAGDMTNRNTYYRGGFDEEGRLLRCEKVVYGEAEVCHEYGYHADGRLAQAIIHDANGDTETLSYRTESWFRSWRSILTRSQYAVAPIKAFAEKARATPSSRHNSKPV